MRWCLHYKHFSFSYWGNSVPPQAIRECSRSIYVSWYEVSPTEQADEDTYWLVVIWETFWLIFVLVFGNLPTECGRCELLENYNTWYICHCAWIGAPESKVVSVWSVELLFRSYNHLLLLDTDSINPSWYQTKISANLYPSGVGPRLLTIIAGRLFYDLHVLGCGTFPFLILTWKLFT